MTSFVLPGTEAESNISENIGHVVCSFSGDVRKSSPDVLFDPHASFFSYNQFFSVDLVSSHPIKSSLMFFFARS